MPFKDEVIEKFRREKLPYYESLLKQEKLNKEKQKELKTKIRRSYKRKQK